MDSPKPLQAAIIYFSDFDRFKMAVAQIVGKRLTWKQVIGMQPDTTWAN